MKCYVFRRDFWIFEKINVCGWRGADDSWVVVKNERLAAQRSCPHAQPSFTSEAFAERDEDTDTQADRAETDEPADVGLVGRGKQETIDRIEQQSAELAADNAAHQRSATLRARAAHHVHSQTKRTAKDGPRQTA